MIIYCNAFVLITVYVLTVFYISDLFFNVFKQNELQLFNCFNSLSWNKSW